MQNEPKQVIVIRKDLNMRRGKMAAQAAHASMKVILEMMTTEDDPMFPLVWMRLGMTKDGPIHQWLVTGRFKKICVSVDSERELMEIYGKALQHNVVASVVVDSGLTEFDGVPTKTCIVVGPDYPEKIDPITGHLKLL